jgi:hypothetical protein
MRDLTSPGSYVNKRRSRTGPRERQISPVEAIAVLVLIAAVVAMAIWFIFLSSGGLGQGTV